MIGIAIKGLLYLFDDIPHLVGLAIASPSVNDAIALRVLSIEREVYHLVAYLRDFALVVLPEKVLTIYHGKHEISCVLCFDKFVAFYIRQDFGRAYLAKTSNRAVIPKQGECVNAWKIYLVAICSVGIYDKVCYFYSFKLISV